MGVFKYLSGYSVFDWFRIMCWSILRISINNFDFSSSSAALNWIKTIRYVNIVANVPIKVLFDRLNAENGFIGDVRLSLISSFNNLTYQAFLSSNFIIWTSFNVSELSSIADAKDWPAFVWYIRRRSDKMVNRKQQPEIKYAEIPLLLLKNTDDPAYKLVVAMSKQFM